MSAAFTESVVEDAALAWLEALGYAVKHGPEIAAGEPAAERAATGRSRASSVHDGIWGPDHWANARA